MRAHGSRNDLERWQFGIDRIDEVFAGVADIVFGTGLAGFGRVGNLVVGPVGTIVIDEIGFEDVVGEYIDNIWTKLTRRVAEVLEVGDGELHGVEETGCGARIDTPIEKAEGDFGDADLDGFGVFEQWQFDVDGI